MNRAERRRQLKQDEKTVINGLDVISRNGAEVVALMRVLHERVLEAQKAQNVRPLMDFLLANIDRAGLRVAHVKVACAKGCAHCCNCWVSVIAPEVIHVVKSLGPRQAAAEAAVLQVLQQSRGKDFEERGRMVTPCPLLQDKLCSVYPNRPLNCRTGSSFDVNACERNYALRQGNEVPVPTVHARMRLGYSLALAGALRHAGLAHAPCEFHGALERVMVNPQAEVQWLAGTDIFAGLPQDPGGDAFQVPGNRALYEAAFG